MPDELPPPPLIPLIIMIGVAGFATVPREQPSSKISPACLAYANYAMDPPQESFFSKVSFLPIFCVGVCYGVCFLFSGSDVVTVHTNWSSTTWICITANLWCITMAGICTSQFWFVTNTCVLSGSSPVI